MESQIVDVQSGTVESLMDRPALIQPSLATSLLDWQSAGVKKPPESAVKRLPIRNRYTRTIYYETMRGHLTNAQVARTVLTSVIYVPPMVGSDTLVKKDI